MKARFDCSHISSKLLIDSIHGLWHNFIRVFNATADTWHPGSQAATALSPAMQASTVERKLFIDLVGLGQLDMLWFSS